MGGSDADKTRKEIYKKEAERYKAKGITARPDRPSDSKVIEYAIDILHDSVFGLSLGDLERILGEKVDKRIKLNVPDQLKQYEARKQEIIARAVVEGKKENEIAQILESIADKESEGAIIGLKQTAYSELRRAAAVKLRDAHEYDDLNADAEEIVKAWRKAKGIPEPETEQPAQAEAREE